MAYIGFENQNPFARPGTLDPSGSLAELNPIRPPGEPMDGACNLHPLITGHYAAVKHTTTIELGGTITTASVWLLTVTPTATINGVPVADALGAITLSVTVGGTQTATALGDLFVTAFTNAKTITTVAAVENQTRIAEILGSLTNDAGTLTAIASVAGDTFDITVTPQAGGTATITNTVDAAGTDMKIGIFIAKTGALHDDGVTPLVRPLEDGDTAASVIGIVSASNTRQKAIDPETGYSFQHIKPGRDVAIIPIGGGHGQWSAYAEAAVDFDDDVWVRVVAGAGEIAGAVNDTPDEVVQTLTITPTPGNNEIASGYVEVFDRDGLSVAAFPYNFTTDADNTAAESVTALGADLTTPIASYAAGSGTDTYILVAVAGYTLRLVNTGAHVLTGVSTGGTIDHVKLPIKFSRTTTAAGSSVIQF